MGLRERILCRDVKLLTILVFNLCVFRVCVCVKIYSHTTQNTERGEGVSMGSGSFARNLTCSGLPKVMLLRVNLPASISRLRFLINSGEHIRAGVTSKSVYLAWTAVTSTKVTPE